MGWTGFGARTGSLSAYGHGRLGLEAVISSSRESAFTVPVHGGSLRRTPEALCCGERGVAQLGSAGALGALGRRFESCRPDLSHSKGSRGSGSPSFLAIFGALSAN